jgi:pimeloyl-ACP methyl ester carboxylesterase
MGDLVGLSGGRQASYEVVGAGEPLLMFPGGPGLPAAFVRADAELLADRFTAYLIDPHGSGGSTPPADPSAYDHRGHAAFYDEVRAALGLERVSVTGVSYGGTVALTYAALYPDHTDRCLAVSAFGFGGDADKAAGGEAEAEMEAMLARHAGAAWYPDARAAWDSWTEVTMAATDGAEIEALFDHTLPLYCAHPDRPDVAEGLARLRSAVRADLAAMQAWEGGLYQTIDLTPLLPAIRCRTLVVAGELDLICGPAQARGIAAGISGAPLVTIPECGHFPALEAPAVYRTAVVDWLAGGG